MAGYVLRRLLQIIPVFLGTTLLIYFLVFALPGDPIVALFGDKTAEPRGPRAAARAVPPRPAVLRAVLLLHDRHLPGRLRHLVQRPAGLRAARPGLPDHAPARDPRDPVRDDHRHHARPDRRPTQGRHLRRDDARRRAHPDLPADLRDRASRRSSSWPSSSAGSEPRWAKGLHCKTWCSRRSCWRASTSPSRSASRGPRSSTPQNQDFVRMAYGKGLPTRRVIPVHILRNSLIPVTTALAANFGILLVGATVTEGVFNIPGVGGTLFRAIKLARDRDGRLVRDRHGHPVSASSTCSSTCCTGCSTRGSAMSSKNPVRRAPHFVAPVDDAALGVVDAVRVGEKKSNLWLDAWRDLRGRPMFWASLVMIVFIVVRRAVPGPLHGRADPYYLPRSSTSNAGTGRDGHPLGFTRQGCDVFSRIVYGASTSLSVGLIVTVMVFVDGRRDGRPRRLLRRLDRLGAHARRRHLLRDPLHPRRRRRHERLLGEPQRLGDLARHRRLRVAVDRAHPEIRGAAHQAVRLRDGVDGARRLALPHPARRTCCRTRSRRSSSSRRSRSPPRSRPRRRCRSSASACPTRHVVGQRHQSGAGRLCAPHPNALLYPSIALSLTVLSFIMLGETLRDALDPKARAQR